MLVFSSFVKLKYMSTYKRTTVWHHWNDHLIYVTMTRLSFTLYNIWIPVMFNINFCIQECKYDKMVWRRRRVGKTMQLIRLISFILILASVTSNKHTSMVFGDVMSTSFEDKLCLHISILAAYMTAPMLSWYRLVVYRVLHTAFFRIRDKSTHDYYWFDVPG